MLGIKDYFFFFSRRFQEKPKNVRQFPAEKFHPFGFLRLEKMSGNENRKSV